MVLVQVTGSKHRRSALVMSAATQQAISNKEEHNRRQAEVFNKKTEAFSAALPPDISKVAPGRASHSHNSQRSQVFKTPDCPLCP